MDQSSVDAVERIVSNGQLFAIILRAEYEPSGIEFLTSDRESFQLGVMERKSGYDIEPHMHLPVSRTITTTSEALFIVRGRLEVNFFDEQRELVDTAELSVGDCVLLIRGGHGFRMLEDSKIIEVKQGPYAGGSFDKFRFSP